LVEGSKTKKFKYSEVSLISPFSGPTKGGLNNELVLIARPKYYDIECLGQKHNGLNSGAVLLLRYPYNKVLL